MGADWLTSGPLELQETFVETLTEGELRSLPWLWEFWALPHQLPPEGDWKTWVALGGRGAGKTRAGAEWVRAQVEGPLAGDKGRAARVAILGETIDQAREVMVFGESGLIACAPPDRRPVWQASRKQLLWPNGAVAQVFSAYDPESLRGPQFDLAWSDELAKWPKGEEAWTMLQFALRLGTDPRQIVTTTPRDVSILKELMARETTVVTSAPTRANRANLAPTFLAEVEGLYGGTLMGRQELEGEMVETVPGAYWTAEALDRLRLEAAPVLDRIVVAIDPAVTSGPKADVCGIVVVGARTSGPPQSWEAVVLEDASVRRATPVQWAEAAAAAYARHKADRVVAEVNQGGDLVQAMLAQVCPNLPYRGVNARRSKAARAEPVAALYEQGRVRHLRHMPELEAEMCRMTRTGYQGSGSPDRMDALVWALTDLILEPGQGWRRPAFRPL